MKKLTLLLIIITACSIGFAAYMGGRQVFFADQFYIDLGPRGFLDCFEFSCLNGECLYCMNGIYRSGLIYDENNTISEVSENITLIENNILKRFINN
jgi:hypothetical protein